MTLFIHLKKAAAEAPSAAIPATTVTPKDQRSAFISSKKPNMGNASTAAPWALSTRRCQSHYLEISECIFRFVSVESIKIEKFLTARVVPK